jgi:D-amino peptidase
MHIGVFADLEGSFGIWRMRQCRTGTREWQYGRSCLTADVNSVVCGAFDGGADRVTVKDTHDTGFNCLTDKLDRRVRYVGGHYANPSLFGDIGGIDLVLYVAIHAAAGTPGAFFPHTHYGIFSEVRINGAPAGEMDIYGAYLGEFGIPVGFVSGEDVAVDQALRTLPWAKAVRVSKAKETYTSGEKSLVYLEEGRRELRASAAEAVRGVSRMRPLRLKGPLRFDAVFRTEELAIQFNTWNFERRAEIVSWDAADMLEGFEKLNRLVFIPKKAYPFRRPLAFALRSWFRMKTRWFAPRPDSGGAPFSG